jgi:hypothetical protein
VAVPFSGRSSKTPPPSALLVLLALLTPRPVLAAVPVPSDSDRQAAEQVSTMTSGSPIDRLVQLLSALDLDEGALYALAGVEPILVSQVEDPSTRLLLEYLKSLPATELSDLRAGRTVVRSKDAASDRERGKLVDLADAFDLKKPKKIEAIRIGVVPGLKMRVELVGKKGNLEVELAWSATPDREARARDELARVFGAPPAEITSGPGSRLPLEDPSFEKSESLGSTWALPLLFEKGSSLPLGEVALDRDVVLDGHFSLRFHSDDQTRAWSAVSQPVTVMPGTPLVLHGHFKARGVQAQRDQEKLFYARMVFTDFNGRTVGQPVVEPITLSDCDWREFTLEGTVPAGAALVHVEAACTMSGTAWFDAFSLEVGH